MFNRTLRGIVFRSKRFIVAHDGTSTKSAGISYLPNFPSTATTVEMMSGFCLFDSSARKNTNISTYQAVKRKHSFLKGRKEVTSIRLYCMIFVWTDDQGRYGGGMTRLARLQYIIGDILKFGKNFFYTIRSYVISELMSNSCKTMT